MSWETTSAAAGASGRSTRSGARGASSRTTTWPPNAVRPDGTTNYPGPVEHPGLALPRSRPLRIRHVPGVELRDRDPRRRGAGLPGRGADLPAAAAGQLAGAGRLYLRPRHRQHQLGFRTPTSRATSSGSIPAPRTSGAISPAPSRTCSRSARRTTGTPDSRSAPTGAGLGHARQPHLRAFRRNLPVRVEEGQEYEFAGTTRRWLSPTAVGTPRNPSYGMVEVRLLCNYRLAGIGWSSSPTCSTCSTTRTPPVTKWLRTAIRFGTSRPWGSGVRGRSLLRDEDEVPARQCSRPGIDCCRVPRRQENDRRSLRFL